MASEMQGVNGVDITLEMLRAAQGNTPSPTVFIKADALHMHFIDSSFDAVCCGFSLSHFQEPAKALQEIHRILRAGGCLIASCWGAVTEDPSFATVTEILMSIVEQPSSSFRYCIDEKTWKSPQQGCEILRGNGFGEVSCTTISRR